MLFVDLLLWTMGANQIPRLKLFRDNVAAPGVGLMKRLTDVGGAKPLEAQVDLVCSLSHTQSTQLLSKAVGYTSGLLPCIEHGSAAGQSVKALGIMFCRFRHLPPYAVWNSSTRFNQKEEF